MSWSAQSALSAHMTLCILPFRHGQVFETFHRLRFKHKVVVLATSGTEPLSRKSLDGWALIVTWVLLPSPEFHRINFSWLAVIDGSETPNTLLLVCGIFRVLCTTYPQYVSALPLYNVMFCTVIKFKVNKPVYRIYNTFGTDLFHNAI